MDPRRKYHRYLKLRRMGRRKGSTFRTDALVFIALNSHWEAFNEVERCNEALKEIERRLDQPTRWEAPLLIDSRKSWTKKKQEAERLLKEIGLNPNGLTFEEIVDCTRLSNGAVSACLRRFCETGCVSTSKGDKKRYKITNREGLLRHILSNVGEFKRVKGLFKKTMRSKDGRSSDYKLFWTTVLQEEVKKAIRRIDDLSIMPEDLDFIMLYDDYLWSLIPKDGQISFEDYFYQDEVRFHPPMTELIIYLMLKYPMVGKLLEEERKRGRIKLSKKESDFSIFWEKVYVLRKHKEKLERIKNEMFERTMKSPRIFFETKPCPHCGNSKIICDFNLGEIVCSKCGTMLKKIWWET